MCLHYLNDLLKNMGHDNVENNYHTYKKMLTIEIMKSCKVMDD